MKRNPWLSNDEINRITKALYEENNYFQEINITPVCTDITELVTYINQARRGIAFNVLLNETDTALSPHIVFMGRSDRILIPIFHNNHFVLLYGNGDAFTYVDTKGTYDHTDDLGFAAKHPCWAQLDNFLTRNSTLDDDILYMQLLRNPALNRLLELNAITSLENARLAVQSKRAEYKVDCQSRSETAQFVKTQFAERSSVTISDHTPMVQLNDDDCGWLVIINAVSMDQQSYFLSEPMRPENFSDWQEFMQETLEPPPPPPPRDPIVSSKEASPPPPPPRERPASSIATATGTSATTDARMPLLASRSGSYGTGPSNAAATHNQHRRSWAQLFCCCLPCCGTDTAPRSDPRLKY